jgi:hypothetical protein
MLPALERDCRLPDENRSTIWWISPNLWQWMDAAMKRRCSHCSTNQ